jgi:hypothetical protein
MSCPNTPRRLSLTEMKCNVLWPLLTAIALSSAIINQSPAEAEEQQLIITGTDVLPNTLVQEIAGAPPHQLENRKRWAEYAVVRIIQLYRGKGYRYARGWFHVNDQGIVRLHIDEGRMRVVFTGAGSLSAFFYRFSLNLPSECPDMLMIEDHVALRLACFSLVHTCPPLLHSFKWIRYS